MKIVVYAHKMPLVLILMIGNTLGELRKSFPILNHSSFMRFYIWIVSFTLVGGFFYCCDPGTHTPLPNTLEGFVHLGLINGMGIFDSLSLYVDSCKYDGDAYLNRIFYSLRKKIVFNTTNEDSIEIFFWTAHSDFPEGRFYLRFSKIRGYLYGIEYEIEWDSSKTMVFMNPYTSPSQRPFGMGFVIDMNSYKSILPLSSGTNLQYLLQPKFRLMEDMRSGRIIVSVSNSNARPVACVVDATDTLTWALPDKRNGKFYLRCLPEGSYTVVIRDSLGKSYVKNNVSVIRQTDTDLGSVPVQ